MAPGLTLPSGATRGSAPYARAHGRQGLRTMGAVARFAVFTTVTLVAGTATAALAQTPDPDTRRAAIEREQTEKASSLHPYVPSRAEKLITEVENTFVNSTTMWHPYFENAYSGG